MLFFWTFYSSKNPEKLNVSVSTKILGSITVFNIDNNQKCFLSSILQWFLKIMWHCRLEQWCWKYSFDQINKLHFNTYTHRNQLFRIFIIFHNIIVFTVFYNCSLGGQKRLLSKTLKMSYWAQTFEWKWNHRHYRWNICTYALRG